MDWQKKDSHWHFTYWGKTSAQPPQSEVVNSRFYPLSQAKAGDIVWLVEFQDAEEIPQLAEMGITPGISIEIVHTQPGGSILFKVNNKIMGLGAGIAREIVVSDNVPKQWEQDTRTYIREMETGTLAQVVGYDKILQGYKGKLLAMGLKPGTQFTVISVPASGNPVKISVRGFILTLSKQEADALVVEVVDNF